MFDANEDQRFNTALSRGRTGAHLRIVHAKSGRALQNMYSSPLKATSCTGGDTVQLISKIHHCELTKDLISSEKHLSYRT